MSYARGVGSGRRRRSLAVETLEARQLLSLAVVEYAVPTSKAGLEGIAAGPDGALWFAESDADKLGRIDPKTHAIAEFPLPTADAGPSRLVAGPDGGVWFTEGKAGKVGRIDPVTHAIVEVALPTAKAGPGAIAAGPDGALWFTEPGLGDVGRIDAATHAVSEFNVLPPNVVEDSYNATTYSGPFGIAAGKDGQIYITDRVSYWFGNQDLPQEASSGEARRIDPTSHVVSKPLGAGDADIADGPDGNLWFLDQQGVELSVVSVSNLERIDPRTGASTDYTLPDQARSGMAESIASGPGGDLWFTEGPNYFSVDPLKLEVIFRFDPKTQGVTEVAIPTSGIRPKVVAAGPDGDLWFTESGDKVGVVVVNPAPPTVALASTNPTPTYGSPQTLVAAVASPSGAVPTGTVQFAVDGVATGPAVPLVKGVAAGPTLAALHAGPHAITATYSGDDSDLPATATLAESVARAPLTIVANSATKLYGRPVPPTFAAGFGFVLGQGLANLSGTLNVATAASAASHVGFYPVTPGGLTSADYAITYLSGSIAVTPAPLTIAADPVSRAFGQPNPLLSASYTGFVNGDTPAGLATPVAFWALAGPSSPVGTYPIAVYGASSPDYAITFRNGTIAVTPPPPGATPADQGRTAFVTTLYQEVLGRDADPGGLAFWVRALGRGATQAAVAISLWDSMEHVLLLGLGRAPRVALATALADAQAAGQAATWLATNHPKGPLS